MNGTKKPQALKDTVKSNEKGTSLPIKKENAGLKKKVICYRKRFRLKLCGETVSIEFVNLSVDSIIFFFMGMELNNMSLT